MKVLTCTLDGPVLSCHPLIFNHAHAYNRTHVAQP